MPPFFFGFAASRLLRTADNSCLGSTGSPRSPATCRTSQMTLPSWCGLNHLQLNVSKTKELVVDFRKQRTHLDPVTIRGTEVDIVDTDKYPGVHLDNKLDWTLNTNAIFKKGQSRLFFLRRLRSFNVCRTMPQMFYHLLVSSVIFKTADANRLKKLIRRAGSVLGVELESVVQVSEKLLSIMDVHHLLHGH